MRKRHLIGALFLTVAVIILPACGSNDLSEDDAEKALWAAFEGDTANSNKMLCPSEQASEPVPMPQKVVFKEVTCEKQGDNRMQCTTAYQADDVDHQMIIIFKVQDGHLCDAHVMDSEPASN